MFRFFVLVFVVFVICDDQDFYEGFQWDEWSGFYTLQLNGDIRVEETLTVKFFDGEFSESYRTIPTGRRGRNDGINETSLLCSEVVSNEDGTEEIIPYEYVSADSGEELSSYEFYMDVGEGEFVVHFFFPETEDMTRTWILEYSMISAIRIDIEDDDIFSFDYKVVPEEHNGVILESEFQIVLPYNSTVLFAEGAKSTEGTVLKDEVENLITVTFLPDYALGKFELFDVFIEFENIHMDYETNDWEDELDTSRKYAIVITYTTTCYLVAVIIISELFIFFLTFLICTLYKRCQNRTRSFNNRSDPLVEINCRKRDTRDVDNFDLRKEIAEISFLEVCYLVKGYVKREFLVAQILDLAVRGFIEITAKKRKSGETYIQIRRKKRRTGIIDRKKKGFEDEEEEEEEKSPVEEEEEDVVYEEDERDQFLKASGLSPLGNYLDMSIPGMEIEKKLLDLMFCGRNVLYLKDDMKKKYYQKKKKKRKEFFEEDQEKKMKYGMYWEESADDSDDEEEVDESGIFGKCCNKPYEWFCWCCDGNIDWGDGPRGRSGRRRRGRTSKRGEGRDDLREVVKELEYLKHLEQEGFIFNRRFVFFLLLISSCAVCTLLFTVPVVGVTLVLFTLKSYFEMTLTFLLLYLAQFVLFVLVVLFVLFIVEIWFAYGITVTRKGYRVYMYSKVLKKHIKWRLSKFGRSRDPVGFMSTKVDPEWKVTEEEEEAPPEEDVGEFDRFRDDESYLPYAMLFGLHDDLAKEVWKGHSFERRSKDVLVHRPWLKIEGGVDEDSFGVDSIENSFRELVDAMMGCNRIMYGLDDDDDDEILPLEQEQERHTIIFGDEKDGKSETLLQD